MYYNNNNNNNNAPLRQNEREQIEEKGSKRNPCGRLTDYFAVGEGVLLLLPLAQCLFCSSAASPPPYTLYLLYYIIYTSDFLSHIGILRPPTGHAHWPNVLNITRCRSPPPPPPPPPSFLWPDELLSAIFRAERVPTIHYYNTATVMLSRSISVFLPLL